MTSKELKPLLGFGWVGWAAIAAGLCLIVCLFLGIDLQLWLLQALYAAGDWPLVYWFVTGPFASASLTLFDSVFGLVPLAGLLIAARICHRPVPAWLCWLAVLLALVGWMEWLETGRLIYRLFSYGGHPWIPGYQSATLVVATVLARAMFRSACVTIAFAIAVLLPWANFVAGIWGWYMPAISIRGTFFDYAWLDFPALVLLTVVVPTVWAIRDRKNFRNPLRVCMACGYSRDGLGVGLPCPECGSAGPVAEA